MEGNPENRQAEEQWEGQRWQPQDRLCLSLPGPVVWCSGVECSGVEWWWRRRRICPTANWSAQRGSRPETPSIPPSPLCPALLSCVSRLSLSAVHPLLSLSPPTPSLFSLVCDGFPCCLFPCHRFHLPLLPCPQLQCGAGWAAIGSDGGGTAGAAQLQPPGHGSTGNEPSKRRIRTHPSTGRTQHQTTTVNTHTHIHTYIHTHTHTYTHTYPYTPTRVDGGDVSLLCHSIPSSLPFFGCVVH